MPSNNSDTVVFTLQIRLQRGQDFCCMQNPAAAHSVVACVNRVLGKAQTQSHLSQFNTR